MWYRRALVLASLMLVCSLSWGDPTDDVYQRHCAECHGPDRLGRIGPALLPENLARASSIAALELFRERLDRYDLVITDMTMPNMTGLQLAKEMLRIRPNIPIILCTGFSHTVDADKAKKSASENSS